MRLLNLAQSLLTRMLSKQRKLHKQNQQGQLRRHFYKRQCMKGNYQQMVAAF